MHTKFSAPVLKVVNGKRYVMPPQFFPQVLGVNSGAYIDVLCTLVNLWIDRVKNGWHYFVQLNHITPNCWPLSSPDLNPIDYYAWHC